MLYGVNILIA